MNEINNETPNTTPTQETGATTDNNFNPDAGQINVEVKHVQNEEAVGGEAVERVVL